jgi:hypothetical protein
MPVHDWSRVSDGTFHDFHCAWNVELRNALNNGILPANYYAMVEQIAGGIVPDVLTLETLGGNGEIIAGEEIQGATAVALAPPRVRFTATTEMDEYVLKQRTLVVRHTIDDRIVALLEILSPGNKSSRHALRSFAEKATNALARGHHLLLLDLQPPSPRDPNGIHGAIWEEISEPSYQAPDGKPLTLVAYSAGRPKTAYIEPIAIGDALPEMPLFLDPWSYVSVPLEATYRAAYRGVPRRWARRPRTSGARRRLIFPLRIGIKAFQDMEC